MTSLRLFTVGLLVFGGLLSGCAATRVTLRPDHSGHVGAVTVSSAEGQQRIDQAFSTDVVKQSSAPGAPGAPPGRSSFGIRARGTTREHLRDEPATAQW